MLLLQFSTSHYCRKARLALGYKKIPYQLENLTPGVHRLKLKPLTGLTTVPALLPQRSDCPTAIADSTRILRFLEQQYPEPSWGLADPQLQTEAWVLEDWLDESIGIATRFVYYEFRANAGKSVDPSLASQILIQVVRRQYGINAATAALAENRLQTALQFLHHRWTTQEWLVGDRVTVADLTAAALCSPLMLIPSYRQGYPWLGDRIRQIHHLCNEPLPPGLSVPD